MKCSPLVIRLVILIFLDMVVTSCVSKPIDSVPPKQIEVIQRSPQRAIFRLAIKSDTTGQLIGNTVKYKEPVFFERILKENLKKSNLFSEVDSKPIPQDVFEKLNSKGLSFDNLPDSFDRSFDLQMNFFEQFGDRYTVVEVFRPAWFLFHLATLGLLPFERPFERHYFGDFRNNKGEIVYSFDKHCSAAIWSWSPFLFTENWRMNPLFVDEDLDFNCVNSILIDAQKAKAL